MLPGGAGRAMIERAMGHRFAPYRRLLRTGFALAALAAATAGSIPARAAVAEIEPSASLAGNFLAGRHAERARDHGAAALFFAAALARAPGNFELSQRLHNAHLAAGAFDAALVAAQRVVAASPANPAARLTLAVDAAQRLAWEDAARLLGEIPLQGVHRLLVPLLRAWIDTARGRATALDHLAPLAEIQEMRAVVNFHRALILDKLDRAEEAEAAFRSLLGPEGQTSARIAEAMAAFLLARGREADARAMLETARAQDRDSLGFAMLLARFESPDRRPMLPDARAGFAAALFDIGSVLRGDGDGTLSLPFARLALVLMPEDPSVLLLVGDILDQQRRLAEANALFGRIDPGSPIGWVARLRIAENEHQLGRTEAAIAMLEAMAAERADRIEPLATLGGILRQKEKYAEAAPVYDRAIARLQPAERRHWILHYARGIAFERSDRWANAEADFQRALELMPEQPDVMNYLAYSWVDKGFAQHYETALRMLERAVELRPESGHIIDSLAWALYKLGRHAESVPLLERAVELLPREAVILDHLGDAYWKVGRRLEARYQWRRALESKPEPDLKPQLEKKLETGLE